MKNICTTLCALGHSAALSIGFLLLAQNLWAENYTAQIFEMNADVQKDAPLYKVTSTETVTDGISKKHTVYSNLDGKEAIVEDVELKGTDVVSYKVQQKQLGDEGSIIVKDKKVFFTYKKKDHEAKTSDENYVDNLAIGPSIVPYVQKYWDDIKAGKKVSIRLAVADRRETVGFDLRKDDSSTDAKTIIKMKASSLVISALVDPLYFTFLPDGSHMTEMKGRIPFKKEHDGKFSDQDAYTVYKFE